VFDAAGFIELAGAVTTGEHIGLPGVDYGQGALGHDRAH